MTALADSPTRAFFREALALVRSYPLDPDDPPPALGGWPAPPDATRGHPRSGDVCGRSGDLCEHIARLRAGETTVAAIAASSRGRIERFNGSFGAFEYVVDTSAEVDLLSAEAAAGRWRGPLHGIPVSVKDVIHVAGMPTSGSSAAYGRAVAVAEGLAVQRLREAGALIAGKTVSHEFALGVTTPQSGNPWDPRRIPGGSSGGSAISVVTGMADASLGTDTRASIRVPAALSGAVGFKPSFGRVPADGILTLSWSMDHVAPMARSVRDIAALMDVLTASPGMYRSGLPGSVAERRFVTSPALRHGCDDAVRAALDATLAALVSAGADVVERGAPSADDLMLANAAGMIVSRCEAATYHQDLGTLLARCTAETAEQLAEATAVQATDYVRAQRLRALLRRRLLAALEGADALIMPTSKVLAPFREDAGGFLLVLSENCIPWSFVDLPAISLPAGMGQGLPIGVQLVGRPGADVDLLGLAHGLEELLPPLPEWKEPVP
jgi:aspartyl-tRNA(Asn)/glutamyl-tRNA(Gln) amidotransferase subunit A